MHILEIVEILGTIAFAMSGAFVAIDKELDYYGIAIFAIVTATGGGIIRDVLVSKNVPTSLENPFFALISIASAVIVIFFYNKFTTTNTRKIIQYLDAAGLAAFTAIGARVALINGFDQPYVIITFAVLTGTGGGVIRDVFAREIPFVFRKEVYAVASIIGAVVYMIAWEWFGAPAALYSCLATTLFIRIYSLEKDLHLDCVKKH